MTNYLSMTDEKLVSLCRNSDEEALTELTKRYIPVSTLLSSKIHNCQIETDDLIQEGMIGFLSAVNSYRNDYTASFRTYAGVCIKNRISNAVRSYGSGKVIPKDLLVSFDDEIDITDSSLTPEELMVSKNETERISSIIETDLTEKEKTVLLLFIRGNSYREICDKTGMTKKSVDGTLQRARKKLRNQL